MSDTNGFQERMLQRFLTQPSATAREDVDYLIERMDQLGRRVRATARREQVKGAA